MVTRFLQFVGFPFGGVWFPCLVFRVRFLLLVWGFIAFSTFGVLLMVVCFDFNFVSWF